MEIESGKEDRISRLPNTILGHILSYLTTAESVRTSILSKIWSSVWSYVPLLDLDDSLLSRPDPNKDQAVHSSFIRFLNNVFNLHKSFFLQKFTLKCSKFDCYRVNEWLMAAMNHKVSKLDLCVTMNENFKLAVPLFEYQHLVSLKLGKKFVLDIPGKVLLPCLEKLQLDSIEFMNDESCCKLFSGCPVLKYLYIEECHMQNVKTLHINAPALMFLVVEHWDTIYSSGDYEYKIVIDAPNLESFVYESHLAKSYSFKNLHSPLDAYIDVDICHWDRSKIKAIRNTALELVRDLSNVGVVTFTGYSLEVLSFLDLTTFPIFNECTELRLGVNEYCGTLLPKLLENFPSLQVLILDKDCTGNGSLSKFVWNDPIQVPQCLLRSLKTVQILGTGRQIHVTKFMKYLIANSKVLTELSSGMDKEEVEEIKVCKKLLSSFFEE